MTALIHLLLFFSFSDVFFEVPTGIFVSQFKGDEIYWKLTRDSSAVTLEYLTRRKKEEQYFASDNDNILIFKNMSLFEEPMDFYISTVEPEGFTLKNDNSQEVIFLRKISQRTDFALRDVPKLIKRDLDLDLIGDWIILYLLNPTGGREDFELSGKDYKVGFSASGNWVLDPRAIKEQLSITGVEDFSFSDIPTATWKAKDGELQVLIDMPGVPSSGPSISKFLIRKDTLFTTSPQGYTTVHLRKK